ncbi:chromobox protein [Encephalitozoon intestinalis ATCC 50506]|uniref:Chromobox protein n=1 Tax=Encephalitozoon intestinalis (strain ATCC 50506) TaxID=876142 RepID=E0S618_ENCIT|nr:chromobox protein [Encephalitozoon intestinalis ATCC 50506]ADM11153.1 chromobox protein [Encephalitozoon intestinalis ATCC 50506]UTX44818.1 chromobox protein [Encephalitozoon intestinalis]
MRDENIYVVDKIVGCRKKGGKKQYLVKWEGYSDSENTWEDEKNIFCKDLIKKYEESQEKLKRPSRKVANRKTSPKKLNKSTSEKTKVIINDWDELVNKVISVEKKGASLMVWLQFKDGKKGSFPASQIHIKCPLHLLEYYENNLVFCEDGGDNTK